MQVAASWKHYCTLCLCEAAKLLSALQIDPVGSIQTDPSLTPKLLCMTLRRYGPPCIWSHFGTGAGWTLAPNHATSPCEQAGRETAVARMAPAWTLDEAGINKVGTVFLPSFCSWLVPRDCQSVTGVCTLDQPLPLWDHSRGPCVCTLTLLQIKYFFPPPLANTSWVIATWVSRVRVSKALSFAWIFPHQSW